MRGTVHVTAHDKRRQFNLTQAVCHTPIRNGSQRSDRRIQIGTRSCTSTELVERIVLAIHEPSCSKPVGRCLDAVRFELRNSLLEGLKALR